MMEKLTIEEDFDALEIFNYNILIYGLFEK